MFNAQAIPYAGVNAPRFHRPTRGAKYYLTAKENVEAQPRWVRQLTSTFKLHTAGQEIVVHFW